MKTLEEKLNLYGLSSKSLELNDLVVRDGQTLKLGDTNKFAVQKTIRPSSFVELKKWIGVSDEVVRTNKTLLHKSNALNRKTLDSFKNESRSGRAGRGSRATGIPQGQLLFERTTKKNNSTTSAVYNPEELAIIREFQQNALFYEIDPYVLNSSLFGSGVLGIDLFGDEYFRNIVLKLKLFKNIDVYPNSTLVIDASTEILIADRIRFHGNSKIKVINRDKPFKFDISIFQAIE